MQQKNTKTTIPTTSALAIELAPYVKALQNAQRVSGDNIKLDIHVVYGPTPASNPNGSGPRLALFKAEEGELIMTIGESAKKSRVIANLPPEKMAEVLRHFNVPLDRVNDGNRKMTLAECTSIYTGTKRLDHSKF